MPQLQLRGRVGLIMVVTILAGWLVLVSAHYVGQGAGRLALPSPGQLVAMVEAVERAPPEDRALILTAMRTDTRALRVVAQPMTGSTLPELWPVDAATLEGYVQALGDRPLAAFPQSVEGPFQFGFTSALNAVEFRIGLAGGNTLIVFANSPVIVAPFGLPVGFGAALAGVLISLIALVLLHREFKPLSRLADAVDKLDPGAGMTLPPIKARSPEVRSLIVAFEELQARVSTLLRARMALIGGIQHDLRTFATRLRLRTDQISDDTERARAAADIDDMIALLDDALLASRAGVSELDQELVDLTHLVKAEIADRLTTGGDVALAVLRDDREAVVLGDRLALRRVLANLVENALRYGRKAHLTLRCTDTEAVLLVDDEGPGIPLDQRALLLEPFTRAETSRARKTGGSGLGLAVVSSLVEAHDGAIEIDDAPTGGARIAIRLPLFSPGRTALEAGTECEGR
ncbi:MAG: ATP-binding protein [Pseudomonadota bacterium]